MIYILGINDHHYQAINPRNKPHEDKFHDFILKQVKAKNIDHLAEEMNDEFLQREDGAQESVCRKMPTISGSPTRCVNQIPYKNNKSGT